MALSKACKSAHTEPLPPLALLQTSKLVIQAQAPFRHSLDTGYGVKDAMRFGRVQFQAQLNAAAR